MYIAYEYTENERLKMFLALNQLSKQFPNKKTESKKLDCL